MRVRFRKTSATGIRHHYFRNRSTPRSAGVLRNAVTKISVPEETCPVRCRRIDTVLARGTNDVRPGAGSLEALQGERVLLDRRTEAGHGDRPAAARRLYHVEP